MIKFGDRAYDKPQTQKTLCKALASQSVIFTGNTLLNA